MSAAMSTMIMMAAAAAVMEEEEEEVAVAMAEMVEVELLQMVLQRASDGE